MNATAPRRRQGAPTNQDDPDDMFLAPRQDEAEKAVLGSILLRSEVLDDVALEIEPGDLYDEVHRLLFTHMLKLHDDGRKVDLAALVASLKKAKGDSAILETVGGLDYLRSLLELLPTAGNARFYAQKVREAAILRSIQYAAGDALKAIKDGPESARDVLGVLERDVFAIAERDSRSQFTAGAGDVMHESLAGLEQRRNGKATGIPSGFEQLDAITGGLRPGEVTIVAGRTSMGKSALAINIAEAVIRKGKSVLYVSLEMSRVELGDRLLSSAARIDSHRMRSGVLGADERRTLVETAGEIGGCQLVIDDSPTRSARDIAAVARRLRRRSGLDLIVVDYLQLVEPEDRKAQRHEQVAAVSRRMKSLAREMECPILCLAQLNRQSETTGDNRPKLSHLRESGAIEQDADVVLFVHRPGYYERRPLSRDGEKAEIIVAKNRNGRTGPAEVLWFGQFTRFDNEARSSEFNADQWAGEQNF